MILFFQKKRLLAYYNILHRKWNSDIYIKTLGEVVRPNYKKKLYSCLIFNYLLFFQSHVFACIITEQCTYEQASSNTGVNAGMEEYKHEADHVTPYKMKLIRALFSIPL